MFQLMMFNVIKLITNFSSLEMKYIHNNYIYILLFPNIAIQPYRVQQVQLISLLLLEQLNFNQMVL